VPTNIPSDLEAALIEKARLEPIAFAELYQAFVRPVYRYVYSRIRNVRDAEDLTSQVFLEVFTGLPQYQHRGYFSAWLFSIARNKVVDLFRRGRVELSMETADLGPDDEVSPLVKMIQKEDIYLLAQEIQRLDESDQELLRLRYIAELSFPEIATLLGLSTATTKKRLYRLLARIESQLEANYE